MGGRSAAMFHGAHVVQCNGGLWLAVGPAHRMGRRIWLGQLVYAPAQAGALAHLAKRLLLLLKQRGNFFQLSLHLAKQGCRIVQ